MARRVFLKPKEPENLEEKTEEEIAEEEIIEEPVELTPKELNILEENAFREINELIKRFNALELLGETPNVHDCLEEILTILFEHGFVV